MIKASIVLVLGAGASKPYGYPLGSDLRNTLTSGTTDFINLIASAGGFSPTEITHFMTEFGNSNLASVDVFLERRPALATLGRTMIAAALLRCEPANIRGDWYEYLWNLLAQDAPTADAFRGNLLRIVTFNYDTSLERFLINSARSTYDTSLDEAKKLIDATVHVVHVHGEIPYKLAGSQVSPSATSPENVREFAGKIITLHQGQDKSPEFTTSRLWLAEAKRALIMGFSYQSDNVRRLRVLDWLTTGKTLRGTTLGMVGQEVTRLAKMFPSQNGQSVVFQNWNCFEMVRHNVGLLLD